MSETSYFPVTPTVTDPDAQLATGVGVRRGGIDARMDRRDYNPEYAAGARTDDRNGPHPPKGFFQEHKFAIIVSAIVLVIIIVVLYMYLTRKGDKRKKANAAREEETDLPSGTQLERMFYGRGMSPTGPDGKPAGPEGVDLDELSRLRELRRKTKAGPAPGAEGMASTYGSTVEDAVGNGTGMQNGRSVTVTTVGIAIPRPQGHPTRSPEPPAPRPPPATPAAKPKKGQARPPQSRDAEVDHPILPRPRQAPSAQRLPQGAQTPVQKPAQVAQRPTQTPATARPPATQKPAVRPVARPAQPSAAAAIAAAEAKTGEDAEVEAEAEATEYDVGDVYQGAIATPPPSGGARDDIDVLIDSLGDDGH